MDNTCVPQPSFMISEEIHPALYGVKPGPSGNKVFRRVYQVCDVIDYFYEGEKLSSPPKMWQYMADFVIPGKQISTRPTGQREVYQVYAGTSHAITPIGKISDWIPGVFTREYTITPPSPHAWGRDPIPEIKLHGNPGVKFTMPGGQGPAKAFGVYNKTTNRFEQVEHSEYRQIIQMINQSK